MKPGGRVCQAQVRFKTGNPRVVINGHFSVDFAWISRESSGTDLILFFFFSFLQIMLRRKYTMSSPGLPATLISSRCCNSKVTGKHSRKLLGTYWEGGRKNVESGEKQSQALLP